MRGGRAGPAILLAAFILVVCLSWAIWLPMRGHVQAENHENRNMAERPALTAENYERFPSEFEAYLNDHMPFRSALINLNSLIDVSLLRVSSNPQVIIGSDDWLFYDNEQDGDPIKSYMGRDLRSEGSMARITEKYVGMRDLLAAQGRELVIFFAPNKERAYSEYMPGRYGQPAEEYGLKRLIEYMRANSDLRIVYPWEELMDAKRALAQNLYYKTDTHWNYVGGYIGARALLAELGVDLPEITGEGVDIVAREHFAGDLAGMLNLNDQMEQADWEYEVTGYGERDVEKLEDDFFQRIVCRTTGADPRRIYVIRDSFFISMTPYVSARFDDCCYRHITSYTPEDFDAFDPDVVVMECVERDLGLFRRFSLEKGIDFEWEDEVAP